MTISPDAYLSTRLGRDFKGCLESSSLLGCKYRPRPLWPPGILPIITTLPGVRLSFGRLDITVFIIAFNWGKNQQQTVAQLFGRLEGIGDMLNA